MSCFRNIAPKFNVDRDKQISRANIQNSISFSAPFCSIWLQLPRQTIVVLVSDFELCISIWDFSLGVWTDTRIDIIGSAPGCFYVCHIELL